MQWYYEGNGEQQGPVEESALKELFKSGELSSDTRVWRQGMADWVPYSEVFPPSGQVKCPSCEEMTSEGSLIPAGDVVVCVRCKDAVLQRMREGVPLTQDEDVRAIRMEHLKHEASLKSVGILFFLGSGLMIFGGVMQILAAVGSGDPEMVAAIGGAAAVSIVLGLLFFLVAYGYRKLKPWIRIPGGILAGIGLLGFPLGTLLNGYILYLLFSKKGKMVFSKEYAEIIQATPDIKYRTSLISLVVIIILVIAVVGIIATTASQ
ncbi:MAG: DUF4339 domain-containing protein [Opitutales bacterium]